MTFDNEKQRTIILEMISSMNFSGKIVDEIHAFKQQVIEGKIKKPVEEKGENE